MYKKKKISVIIPALNEEDSLPGLIKDIPKYVDRILVTDNGSTDNTFKVLQKIKKNDKRVFPLIEKNKGYGNACLKAMAELKDEDIIVFLDADHSDDPANMNLLLDPIIKNKYDVVISNRFTSKLEKGAMSFPQYFGNKLSVWLIKIFWGFSYKDLGPFRSIRKSALDKIGMKDKNYGWTIELQVKAIESGLKIFQVDVPYLNRALGKSKVSGSLVGAVKAGFKIIYTIFSLKIKSNRF